MNDLPAWLVDEAKLPGVARFLAGQLEGFDLSRVDRFRLSFTSTRIFAGYCRHPVRTKPRARTFRRGYRIQASVHPTPDRYPLEIRDPVATEPTGTGPTDWRYILESVTLASQAEALAYVASHEAFHFLRHSRQVPGRDTEPQANVFALGWLDEWRTAEENPDR